MLRDLGPVIPEIPTGVQFKGDLKRLSEGRQPVPAKKGKTEKKTQAAKKTTARETAGAAAPPPAQHSSFRVSNYHPKPIRLKERRHRMYTMSIWEAWPRRPHSEKPLGPDLRDGRFEHLGTR